MMDEPFVFAEESEDFALDNRQQQPSWKALIVDDDPSVHQITSLLLNRFEYQDRKIQLFHVYSAAEAIQLLQREKDFAVIILDVVMETEFAGLDLVDYIRLVLKNKALKIIMRTGQPGQLNEEKITKDYQVDYFRSKTDMTADVMVKTVQDALSTYNPLN